MTTLVFLEHHDGALQKGSLGVLAKASSLGDVAGVVLGSGVRDTAAQAGRYGAGTVYVLDDPALEAPLPQPRVDALEALVRQTAAETVLFGASVLSADIAAGLAARLDAGLNWDLTDLELRDGELVGTRPALGDTVVAEVGWQGTPRLALFRSGSFDPVETGGEAAVDVGVDVAVGVAVGVDVVVGVAVGVLVGVAVVVGLLVGVVVGVAVGVGVGVGVVGCGGAATKS